MSGSPTNGPGLTWDDLDDLADYAAGVLSGEPAERVAELIRTDERWAAAHAALGVADPVVRTALHAAAAAPTSLPDDVAARIDAMLGPTARAVDSRPTRRARVTGLAGSRPPSRSPASTGPAGPGRSRRPVLSRVMVAVLVLGAIGGVTAVAADFLSNGLPALTTAEDGAPAMAEDAGGLDAPAQETSPMLTAAEGAGERLAGAKLFASGTDYRRETLPQLAAPAPAAAPPTLRSSESVDAALTDLGSPAGLDQCLIAVGLLHPGPVVAVDFARFEGGPAVILVVQQRERSIVVAVGPGCGATGADILASVEVP